MREVVQLSVECCYIFIEVKDSISHVGLISTQEHRRCQCGGLFSHHFTDIYIYTCSFSRPTSSSVALKILLNIGGEI